MPPVYEIHERFEVGVADGNPGAADMDLVVLDAGNGGFGDDESCLLYTSVSGIRFFFWDSQFGRFFNTGPIKGSGDPFFYFHTPVSYTHLNWSRITKRRIRTNACSVTRSAWTPSVNGSSWRPRWSITRSPCRPIISPSTAGSGKACVRIWALPGRCV